MCFYLLVNFYSSFDMQLLLWKACPNANIPIIPDLYPGNSFICSKLKTSTIMCLYLLVNFYSSFNMQLLFWKACPNANIACSIDAKIITYSGNVCGHSQEIVNRIVIKPAGVCPTNLKFYPSIFAGISGIQN